MVTREFPNTCLSAFSSHDPPFRIPADLLQALECPFGPQKDRHANRDKLFECRKEAEKIRADKNRVIYSLYDVPCAKKRQTKKGQLS